MSRGQTWTTVPIFSAVSKAENIKIVHRVIQKFAE
jgi:hypothetical protein